MNDIATNHNMASTSTQVSISCQLENPDFAKHAPSTDRVTVCTRKKEQVNKKPVPDTAVSQEHGPYDVLCDRRNDAFRHVGNKRFRVICEIYLRQYMDAKTKREKTTIFKAVIGTIHNGGGKFLTMNTKSGEWEQVSDLQAKEKVGHTLRNAILTIEETGITSRTIYKVINGQGDDCTKKVRASAMKKLPVFPDMSGTASFSLLVDDTMINERIKKIKKTFVLTKNQKDLARDLDAVKEEQPNTKEKLRPSVHLEASSKVLPVVLLGFEILSPPQRTDTVMLDGIAEETIVKDSENIPLVTKGKAISATELKMITVKEALPDQLLNFKTHRCPRQRIEKEI